MAVNAGDFHRLMTEMARAVGTSLAKHIVAALPLTIQDVAFVDAIEADIVKRWQEIRLQ